MFGRKAVYTYWLYRQLWTNWKLWVRFYPLAILLTMLFSVRVAVLMLASTLGAVLWLFRNTNATLLEKVQGWVVFTVHSVAYSAGFLYEIAARISRRFS
jgi:hypothetical protein